MLKGLIIPQIIAVLFIVTAAYAGEQEVLQALSIKDSLGSQVSGPDELEVLAGGKEELIEILLKYRRSETPPFVGIRAENLLLNYTDNEKVLVALEQDINDIKFYGLARAIGSKIDYISNSAARQRLAKAVVNRARIEKRFELYGRMLKESKDTNVQRLAKDL